MTVRPPHRVLALDASGAVASVGIVDGRSLVAYRQAPSGSGLADRLAAMLAEILAEAGIEPLSIEAVAVIIGPGSFTGIRASLALAHGFGQSLDVPVHGVRLSDAFGCDLAGLTRPLWIAATARRGFVFIERAGEAVCCAEADLPVPLRPVAIAGEAAELVAARYDEGEMMVIAARRPSLLGIADALRARLASGAAPIEALPLYVEPPLARLPTGGLRPAPR